MYCLAVGQCNSQMSQVSSDSECGSNGSFTPRARCDAFTKSLPSRHERRGSSARSAAARAAASVLLRSPGGTTSKPPGLPAPAATSTVRAREHGTTMQQGQLKRAASANNVQPRRIRSLPESRTSSTALQSCTPSGVPQQPRTPPAAQASRPPSASVVREVDAGAIVITEAEHAMMKSRTIGAHGGGGEPLLGPSVSSETRHEANLPAFENWRLDYIAGGPGAVRVSEFADLRPVPQVVEPGRECKDAYGRPANKRDLGHRCQHCRRPFSSLGAELVAEPQQGPAQRFHPECWRKRNGGEEAVLLGHLAEAAAAAMNGEASASSASASTSARGRGREVVSEDSEAGHIVTAYADEWRRAALEGGRRYSGISRPRSGIPPRPSPLDGLVSIEDASGERRVARGFSQREIEVVMTRWACTAAAAGDECAVCFACPQKPLRLPCRHAFCAECVVPWLRRCALCPMCRQDLRPPLESLNHTTSMSAVPTSSPPVGCKGARGAHRRAFSLENGAKVRSREEWQLIRSGLRNRSATEDRRAASLASRRNSVASVAHDEGVTSSA